MSANNKAVIANYLYNAQLQKGKMLEIISEDLILQADFAVERYRCDRNDLNQKLVNLALAKVAFTNAKANYCLAKAGTIKAKQELADLQQAASQESELTPRQQRADKALVIVTAIACSLIGFNFVAGQINPQHNPAPIDRVG